MVEKVRKISLMAVGEVNLDLDQNQEAVLVVMVEEKDHLSVPVCLLIYLINF